jgi:hypothetical protein
MPQHGQHGTLAGAVALRCHEVSCGCAGARQDAATASAERDRDFAEWAASLPPAPVDSRAALAETRQILTGKSRRGSRRTPSS